MGSYFLSVGSNILAIGSSTTDDQRYAKAFAFESTTARSAFIIGSPLYITRGWDTEDG